MWAIQFCRHSLSGVDNDVSTSSLGRFSLALEVGRPSAKARESALVRCLYFDFYFWILFSLYRIKMEISKILLATIVAATLISQTHSPSLHTKPRILQMRVTEWFRRRLPTPCKGYEWAIWFVFLDEVITLS